VYRLKIGIYFYASP